MKSRLLTKRAFNNGFIYILIFLIMMLSTGTTVKASEDVLPEIRFLLRTQYVETVSNEVLNAPTVEEMLKRLGDPHAKYFTPEQYQEFLGSIHIERNIIRPSDPDYGQAIRVLGERR